MLWTFLKYSRSYAVKWPERLMLLTSDQTRQDMGDEALMVRVTVDSRTHGGQQLSQLLLLTF